MKVEFATFMRKAVALPLLKYKKSYIYGKIC